MYIYILNKETETISSIRITDESSYIYELCKDFEENKYTILDELESYDINVDMTICEVFCTEDKLITKHIKI